MEAKVLSNWHEFLVHRQEVQIKFQELFTSCRSGTPRSKGGVALHLEELDRRLGECEHKVLECERKVTETAFECRDHVKNQIVSLTAETSAMKPLLEQEARRHGIEALEALQKHKAETSSMKSLLEQEARRHGTEALEASSAIGAQLRQLQTDSASSLLTFEAALESRLRTSLERVETTLESRMSKAYNEATSATDALEQQLRIARTDATKNLEAAEAQSREAMSAVEKRFSQDLQRVSQVVDRVDSGVDQRLARERTSLEASIHDKASQSVGSLEARLEQMVARQGTQSQVDRSSFEACVSALISKSCEENRADIESRLSEKLSINREEDRATMESFFNSSISRNRESTHTDIEARLSTRLLRLREECRADIDESMRNNALRNRNETMDLARSLEKEIKSLRGDASKSADREDRLAKSMIDPSILEAQKEAAKAYGAVASLEVTFERSRKHNEELDRRISDLHDDFASKHRALENRIKTELSACSADSRSAAARVGERWCEQLGDVDGRLAQVRADAAQAISDTQRLAERLSIEVSNRATSLAGVTGTMHETLDKWAQELIVLSDAQNSLMGALEEMRDGRASADSELQTILSEVRSGAARHASELANLHTTVQDFSQRLGPIEVTISAASSDANIARTDARTALGIVHKTRDEFYHRLDSVCRESPSVKKIHKEAITSEEAAIALSKAADAERLAREVMFGCECAESQTQKRQHDLYLEHRTLKFEFDESVRRMGALERGIRDSSRSEGRLNELATVVEKLAVKIESGDLPSMSDTSLRTEAAFSKVDDMAIAMERLSREVRQGYEKAESSVKRTQDDVARRLADFQQVTDVRWDTVSRSSEQLRVTEGAQRNELWRELRELRSNIGELRLRCGTASGSATPRDLSAFGSRFTGAGKISDMGL